MNDTTATYKEIETAIDNYLAKRVTFEKGNGQKPLGRWKNYWRGRLKPDGTLDRYRLYRAYLQNLKNLQKQRRSTPNNYGTPSQNSNPTPYISPSNNSSPTLVESNPQPNVANTPSNTSNGPWKPVGPDVVPRRLNNLRGIGRLNCVSFHPTNTNTMLVGSPAGGIWTSTDGGQNWFTNTDFMPSLGVSDIVYHPTNHNTIYWATGDADAFVTACNGLFRSTDGGNTWTQMVGFPDVTSITKLLIQPNNANIMLASTAQGIYRSSNGGTSWTQAQGGSFADIVYKPNSYNTVYATHRQSGQFWRSTDAGVSWQNMTTGLPSNGAKRGKIAVSPANANYVYVVFCDAEGSLYGVYRSTDSGQSFSERLRCNSPSTSTPNLLGWNDDGTDYGGQGWYDLAIAVNPSNANDVWVGGVNIWQSTDGGSNWNARGIWSAMGQSSYIHADIHALEYNPHDNTLHVCSDGGIGKRDGNSWQDMSEDLEITQFYSINVEKVLEEHIIAGAQDNGTLRHSSDYNSADNWAAIYSGDGMQCIIDPTNSDRLYAEIQNGMMVRSDDAGISWNYISPETNGAWETPYEMSPNNPQRLVAGYSQLYLTNNRGENWTPLSATSGLVNGSVVDEIELTTNDNIFYFSHYNNIYRTNNSGASWTNISDGLDNISYISDIHSDPRDPNRIWITFSSGNAENSVYTSTDGGDNWINLSGLFMAGFTLVESGIHCITLDTLSDPSNYIFPFLYIGTDLGVFRKSLTANANDMWQQHNLNSLPTTPVYDLEINFNTGYLYAGTHGRGVWKLDISSNTLTPIANFSSNEATCVGQSLQFNDESLFSPSSWSWNFGDGNNSTQQNPTHTYNAAGNYTVTLTVTNANGNDSESKQITVHPAASTINESLTACGSYTNTETDPTVTYTSSGNYTFNSLSGCLTTNLNLTIVEPDDPIYNLVTTCVPYPWSISGETYSESGYYEHLVPPTGSQVCPQTYWLHLNIEEHVEEYVSDCDHYFVGGIARTTSGTYYEIEPVTNCTTKTVHLTITNPQGNTETVNSCEPYQWNGETYDESGNYSVSYYVDGCLVSDILNLTIHEPTNNSEYVTACQSYTWNGNTYTNSGIYSYQTTNSYGCEHTETLNLTIEPTNNTTTNMAACLSYTWPINNQTYYQSGTYNHTSGSTNCQSQHQLHLTINPAGGSQTINHTANGSYNWYGVTYYCSGSYTTSYTDQSGCEFTTILNLTINNPALPIQNVSECDEYYWSANGQTYNVGGIKTATVNVQGCNATAVLGLTLNYSSSQIFDVSAGDSYTWHGQTYYCSGTYYYNTTNSNGCPHTETLNLELDNGW